LILKEIEPYRGSIFFKIKNKKKDEMTEEDKPIYYGGPEPYTPEYFDSLCKKDEEIKEEEDEKETL
jgi:hypothetical protein